MACVSAAPAIPQTSAEEGFARFGERTFVDGPYVQPVALLEDSRCPINARCVWAGRLRITAKITTGPGEEIMELTLGEPVQVADGALELIAADPLPDTDTDNRQRDRRRRLPLPTPLRRRNLGLVQV